MNELKNFAIGTLGTLGAMEAMDTQILSPQEADPQTLITRSVLSLIAGILSAVISKWLKYSASKAVSNQKKTASAQKEPKIKNTFKVKNLKNK